MTNYGKFRILLMKGLKDTPKTIQRCLKVLNTDTYGKTARTERRTRTRKTEECTEGERCGLNVCVVPSLNGRVPFNLREGERDERGADKRELIKSITNCRLTTACTGLYTEENNRNYLTEKYEGRQ